MEGRENMRVFVVGFNKCGTTSLHYFFQACGFNSLQHDRGQLPLRMRDNVAAGRPVFRGYDEYDAFMEMNHLCEHTNVFGGKWFRLMAEQYPDAAFILNVRDVDNWVRSRMEWKRAWTEDAPPARELGRGPDRPCPDPADCWRGLGIGEQYRRYYGFQNPHQTAMHMRAQWHSHVNAVRYGLPEDRLLVFDIERDDPARLCEFLGLPVEYADRYGKYNTSANPIVKRRRNRGRLPARLKSLFRVMMRVQ